MKNTSFMQTLALEPADLVAKAHKTGWVMSLIGSIVYFFLRLMRCEPEKYCGIKYFKIGHSWGGVSLGWFFICAKNASEATMKHEIGHCVQNAAIGGFRMLFYSLGSLIRCGYIKIAKASIVYDSWWFEGTATELGNSYCLRHLNKRE